MDTVENLDTPANVPGSPVSEKGQPNDADLPGSPVSAKGELDGATVGSEAVVETDVVEDYKKKDTVELNEVQDDSTGEDDKDTDKETDQDADTETGGHCGCTCGLNLYGQAMQLTKKGASPFADLNLDELLADALANLDAYNAKWKTFEVGGITYSVYHPSGWGEGTSTTSEVATCSTNEKPSSLGDHEAPRNPSNDDSNAPGDGSTS